MNENPTLIPLTPELLQQLREDLMPTLLSRQEEWNQVEGKLEALGGMWTCSQCPVQAEGEVDGHPWYFRARGDHWSFSVAEVGGDAVGVSCGDAYGWERREEYGDGVDEYAASWMSPIVAFCFICRCMDQFRNGELPEVTGEEEEA